MQFNSLYFILFFLPLSLVGYWLLVRHVSQKVANFFLTGASLVFYGFAGVEALLLLAAQILANWWISRCLDRAFQAGKPRQRRFWLVAGILLNAGLLLYFKYTNFFIENLDAWLGLDWPTKNLFLPLGISFTAFTQIAWLVDAYRGQTQRVTPAEYTLYSVWFPKLTQGPICFQKDFIPQERTVKVLHAEPMVRGITMFTFGLAKKVLLADLFGRAADWGFHYISLTYSWDMVLTMLAYTFQIYFDFSGYSDMALGVSLLFGYELPQNFDSPYKALSITDFWRRWHMSLTSFLREYLYFPLGGSRKGKLRTYVNIMIVFLVSGFWHGASWTFVLWGVVHGALQCLERFLGSFVGKTTKQSGLLTALRWFVTFALVNFLWLLFRSPSLGEFQRALWHMFLMNDARIWEINPELLAVFNLPGLRYLLEHLGVGYSDLAVSWISTLLTLGFTFFLVLVPGNTQRREYKSTGLSLAAVLALFLVCLMNLSQVSTFIYNNF